MLEIWGLEVRTNFSFQGLGAIDVHQFDKAKASLGCRQGCNEKKMLETTIQQKEMSYFLKVLLLMTSNTIAFFK